ncbi:MAG: UvrD-helicase domain-containing protein [Candidatus Krumholzibacteriia bacterium]
MSGEIGKTRALPVDDAARRRAAGDLETSFCVEAGAGTGKTTLLVGRFLAILESGKASCGQIAAITFTEKAAGEMKIRLRKEIVDRCAEPSLAAEARANLERAYDELERSPISTIHSFAATILREYPVEARVDPNYSQLDALGGALFFDECWSDFLARGAEEWEETLRRFIFFGGSIDDLSAIAAELYAHRAERSCERMFGGGSFPGDCTQPPPRNPDPSSELRDEFAAAAARLSALARDRCTNPADRGSLAIREFAAKMGALDLLRGDDLTRFLLTIKLPKNKGSRENWRPAEACAEQKGIFGELDEFRESARAELSDFLRNGLEEFFDEFLASVERRKEALGVLDFDDLLIKVRELLRSESSLDMLRDRYRYILVDEFQDTDPVQAEIVYLLAGAPGGRGRPEPAPGKLFIVGDPKQSIYRFRKADIEIYERVKERLSESGERLSIVENFRSVPGIVGWVNETFSEIMQPSGDGMFQPRYEAIHSFRSGDGSPVVLLDLELAEGDSGTQTIRAREGEAIARLIHKLMENRATVRDPRKRDERALEYGDIAVIYPGTTGIDHYEEPLRAESIPYVVEGGKLYYAREEIRTLAAAVWAIEDPYDPLALVAALRSPMFGASDEDIFLFTRSGGRLDYLDPGEGATDKPGDLGAAFDLLAELHARRNELGPSGTLLELLRWTKFLELSLLRPHGEQRVSNIRKAVSSARAFEEKRASYRRFARWFRDQEALASAEGESPIVEEDENAVRLLTVHKAKGLQFPVVILANLVQSRRASYRILVEEGSRISFKLGLLETSDHEAFEEEEKAREAAETVRLLYVAATRAGDMLVIPRMPKEGSYFGLIKARLVADTGGADGAGADGAGEGGADGTGATGAGAREKPARSAHVKDLSLSSLPPLRGKPRPFTRFTEPSREAASKAARERSEWLLARERLLAEALKAPFVLAPSKLGAEAFAPATPADAPLVFGPGTPAADGPGAVPAHFDADPQSRDRLLLFGQAFHRIMELADFSDAGSLSALAASIAAGLGIEDAGPELERVAEAALRSDLIARASRSPRCFREVSFAVPWEGNFIEGRIDLLFEEDERWTLVDYKTDDVTAARANERIEIYRPQAAVYALALKSLGIECAGGIVLYFARPNAAVTIDYSPDLVEEAASLVRAAIIEQTGARERSRPVLP